MRNVGECEERVMPCGSVQPYVDSLFCGDICTLLDPDFDKLNYPKLNNVDGEAAQEPRFGLTSLSLGSMSSCASYFV